MEAGSGRQRTRAVATDETRDDGRAIERDGCTVINEPLNHENSDTMTSCLKPGHASGKNRRLKMKRTMGVQSSRYSFRHVLRSGRVFSGGGGMGEFRICKNCNLYAELKLSRSTVSIINWVVGAKRDLF